MRFAVIPASSRGRLSAAAIGVQFVSVPDLVCFRHSWRDVAVVSGSTDYPASRSGRALIFVFAYFFYELLLMEMLHRLVYLRDRMVISGIPEIFPWTAKLASGEISGKGCSILHPFRFGLCGIFWPSAQRIRGPGGDVNAAGAEIQPSGL
jgi:hypothetical protein